MSQQRHRPRRRPHRPPYALKAASPSLPLPLPPPPSPPLPSRLLISRPRRSPRRVQSSSFSLLRVCEERIRPAPWRSSKTVCLAPLPFPSLLPLSPSPPSSLLPFAPLPSAPRPSDPSPSSPLAPLPSSQLMSSCAQAASSLRCAHTPPCCSAFASASASPSPPLSDGQAVLSAGGGEDARLLARHRRLPDVRPHVRGPPRVHLLRRPALRNGPPALRAPPRGLDQGRGTAPLAPSHPRARLRRLPPASSVRA